MHPGSTFLIKQYSSLRQRTVSSKVSQLEIVIRVFSKMCVKKIGRDIFLGVIFFFSIGRYFWNEIQFKKLSNYIFFSNK